MDDNKLHIFLSYGHEEKNARIVKEIIAYLSKEFYVWIDKRNIVEHCDWRREIVNGITNTDITLGLLSAYSTRERGVCLDELGISISIPGRKLITVILENEKNINIPSTLTRNQWLDLSQWKDYIETEKWEEYFLEKMDSLVLSINNKENYLFQGEMTTLYKILKPKFFDEKVKRLMNKSNSVNRVWLTNKVNSWINYSDERVLIISGNAGTGKSHFSANFQHYNPSCLACVFCDNLTLNTEYAKDIIRYISYTYAAKEPAYRYQLLNKFKLYGIIDDSGIVHEGKTSDYFIDNTDDYILSDLLGIQTIGGYNNSVMILIDGLDEATGNGNNPVLKLLSSAIKVLPNHIRFIVTSRPEPTIISFLHGIDSYFISLDNENSDKDIALYVQRALNTSLRGGISVTDIDRIVRECDHVFLYAELLCKSIVSPEGFYRNSRELPTGIAGIYTQYFDRLFGDGQSYTEIKQLLRIICSFDKGGIAEEVLLRIAGINRETLNEFYMSMRSFAKYTEIDKVRYVFLYHKSLYDWLIDKDLSGTYYVDCNYGQTLILEQCKQLIEYGGIDESYITLKHVYLYLNNHGFMRYIKTNMRFLYEVMKAAFENDDIELFKRISKQITMYTALTNEKKIFILSQILMSGWLYDVEYEADKAYKIQEELYYKYGEIIKNDDELLCEVEINEIYLLNTYKKEPLSALDHADKLVTYLSIRTDDEFPLRQKYLCKTYYHKGIIELSLKRYSDCLDSCENGLEMAEFAYKEPKKLQCLIYIIQGRSFMKLELFEQAIISFEKSLTYRIDLYGEQSLYVANSYHNLIDAMYEKARIINIVYDIKIYDYIEKYKEIVQTIFGKNNPRLIIYYTYKALLAELEKKHDQALEFACSGLRIEDNERFKDKKSILQQIVYRS